MGKCCVPSCPNSQKKRKNVSGCIFFSFPLDPTLRAEWTFQIGRPNWMPGRQSLVCSAHFKKNLVTRNGQSVALCKGATPTIFHQVEQIKSFDKPTKTDKTGTKVKRSKSQVNGVCGEKCEIQDKVAALDQSCQTFSDTELPSRQSDVHALLRKQHRVSNGLILLKSCDNEKGILLIQKSEPKTLSFNCSQTTQSIQAFPQPLYVKEVNGLPHITIEASVPPLAPLSHQPKILQKGSDETPEADQPMPYILNVEGNYDQNLEGILNKSFESKTSDVGDNERSVWQKGTWMCRLCGVLSDNTLNMFSDAAVKLNVLQRIAALIPITIMENDGLPQCVCSPCLSQLNVCSELIVRSLNTDKQLTSMFRKEADQMMNGIAHYGTNGNKRTETKKMTQKIFIMEVCHDEEKSIEECLAIAAEDIKTRLHDRPPCSTNPQCRLLTLSLCEENPVYQEMRLKTALEAFIKRESEEETYTAQAVMQQAAESCPDTSSETFPIAYTPESSKSVSKNVLGLVSLNTNKILPLTFVAESEENQTLPFVDDINPHGFCSSAVRNPKTVAKWKGRNTGVANLQRIFTWHGSESDGIQLICNLCKNVIKGEETPQTHLKNHADVCCRICLDIFPTESMYTHKCSSKAKRTSGPIQSYSQKLWGLLKKKRVCSWHQCSSCAARFKCKSNLSRHLQQHREANAKNKDCCSGAADLSEPTSHQRSCQNRRQKRKPLSEWKCKKCFQVFQSVDELQEHMAGNCLQNGASEGLCEVCGERFSHSKLLTKHKKKHLPAESNIMYSCPHCPKLFKFLSKLTAHRQIHEEKSFMCKVCGKMFAASQTLRQHEYTHGEPRYLCAVCPRSFFRPSHLVKHMNVHNQGYSRRRVRRGDPSVRDGSNHCRECKELFNDRDLLSHYNAAHPHIALNNYTCIICNQENTSFGELLRHRRDAHKTFSKECLFCMKTTDDFTQMKYHVMRHEGLFPRTCPICNAGFISNSAVQDHIRRQHTGEKPFRCEHCSKCFSTLKALTQHNTVHSLPHQLIPCSMCDHRFKRKAHLDIHMRTHTGEKPYPCPICDRPFRQRPDCLKHIRVIHGEDPAQYKVDFRTNLTQSELDSVSEEGGNIVQDSPKT